MNQWLALGLNALAVVLTGGVAVLTTYQVHPDWRSALISGGIVAGINGLAQLAKFGVVVGTVVGPEKAAR